MRLANLCLIGLLLSQTASFAVDYSKTVDIVIDGKMYHALMGNEEHTLELYYLKKAMEGDKSARSILMNSHKGYIYIGDTMPVWAKVEKDSITVITPGGTNEEKRK